MSFQLMAWAAEQKTGSATRKSVLMAVANASNHQTGRCDPTVEVIAEETELGERAVRQALTDLCDAGLLARTRKARSDGWRGGYMYSFPHLSARGAEGPARRAATGPARGAAEPGVDLEPGALLPETTVREEERAAPKLTKIDGRDVAFDALARVCNARGANRAREVAVALNGDKRRGTVGIRDQFYREVEDALFETMGGPTGEDFERALERAIPARAQLYHAAMSGATLTPTALTKWWGDLPEMAKESSIEGFYDQARDAVERAERSDDAR